MRCEQRLTMLPNLKAETVHLLRHFIKEPVFTPKDPYVKKLPERIEKAYTLRGHNDTNIAFRVRALLDGIEDVVISEDILARIPADSHFSSLPYAPEGVTFQRGDTYTQDGPHGKRYVILSGSREKGYNIMPFSLLPTSEESS